MAALSRVRKRPMIAFVDLSVPITFAIHPDRSLVVVTRLRRTTFEEWSGALTDLLSNPSFRPGFHVVEDARAVVAVPARADVERFARWIHDHASAFGAVRWAMVVPPSANAVFGMARVGEALTAGSGVTLRAFTDLQAAFAWVAGGAEPAWD
jgi:hypothetical protein